jgi:hypothetical protein
LNFNGLSWMQVPLGPNSAHHIAFVELERSSLLPFKVAQLRNLFDKFGMDLMHTNNRSGFGYFHDGSVDTITRFIQDSFGITDDHQTADIDAFLLSFTGSGLIPGSVTDVNRSPGVASLDTPAAVGRQITISNSFGSALITNMIALAKSSTNQVDLIVKGFESGLARGWFYNRTNGLFQSDRLAETETPAALLAFAAPGAEQTYTVVPLGAGWRMGIDRDADGYLDQDEIDIGSDPANPFSAPTNPPPLLAPPVINTVFALKGYLLTLNFTAADYTAGQILTFSLTNSPPGATINPSTGTFAFIPTGPPGPITNSITVVVTNNGPPSLSNSETFLVIANDLSAAAPVASTNGITISWNAIAGLTYRVQYKNNLTDTNWTNLPGDITASNSIALKLDSASTNVTRFYRIIAQP